MKKTVNASAKSVAKRILSAVFVLVLILTAIPIASPEKVGAYNYIAYGIDVSKWQGTIDWDAVKASGIDFVIIKVGSTKGMDEYFEYNYLGAKSRGLNVGAYYYTYASSEEAAAAEAQDVVSWIAGKTFEYPIYFDIEDPSMEGFTIEKRTNMCIAFNTVLENNGYYAGIYANKSWLETKLDKAELASRYTIWEASWRYSGEADLDKSGDCQMWQYTDSGSVSGISGAVDMDVSYVNYPEAIKRVGLNGFSKGTVDSTVCAYYTTTASSLNVRSGPSTDYGIVTSFPFGTKVLVVDANSSGTWVKVKSGTTEGWLSAKYLTLSAPEKIEYNVTYETGVDGVTPPAAEKIWYGGSLTLSAPEAANRVFKGWTVKRVSDGAWYTANGFVNDDTAEKKILSEGETLVFDKSFSAPENGHENYVLTAVWENAVLYGDANGDGTVNARDAIVFRKYLSGLSDIDDTTVLDLDGNGRVSVKDVLQLKKFIKGIINVFPVEQK